MQQVSHTKFNYPRQQCYHKYHFTPHVEPLLVEKQAAFRRGRTTGELIFIFKFLMGKMTEPQRQIKHNLVDYKKVFDMV